MNFQKLLIIKNKKNKNPHNSKFIEIELNLYLVSLKVNLRIYIEILK